MPIFIHSVEWGQSGIKVKIGKLIGCSFSLIDHEFLRRVILHQRLRNFDKFGKFLFPFLLVGDTFNF